MVGGNNLAPGDRSSGLADGVLMCEHLGLWAGCIRSRVCSELPARILRRFQIERPERGGVRDHAEGKLGLGCSGVLVEW